MCKLTPVVQSCVVLGSTIKLNKFVPIQNILIDRCVEGDISISEEWERFSSQTCLKECVTAT